MITIKNISKAVNVRPVEPPQTILTLQLYVDELSELSGLDLEALGLPVDAIIEEGSLAWDKTGSVAILDSTGTWNTIGD